MKKMYLLITSLFLLFETFAQDTSRANCLKTLFCSFSLCDNCTDPFTNIQRDNGVSYKKITASTYPGDKKYPNEDGQGDCVPGVNVCNTGGGILFYDVYYPADYTNYLACP